MVNINFVRCINNQGYEGSLEVGYIYQSLPTSSTEQAAGDLRIVDNEGEDYLYSQTLFVPVALHELTDGHGHPVTTHLDGVRAILVRDQAHARGLSVSALLREWVDERLDLPATA